MKTAAIAIFVKTPGFSPIKTRLAKTKGQEFAETFYKFSLQATEEVITLAVKNSSIQLVPYWAIAEQDAHDSPFWQSFDRLELKGNGLGPRLHHAYSKLKASHDFIFLLGADTPHLEAARVLEGIESLKQHNFSIGAALDGGFYLFGGNCNIPEKCWTNVTYSADTTLAELEAEIKNLGSIEHLDPMSDVDTEEELKIAFASLNENSHRTPAQTALLGWLSAHYG